MRYFQHQFLVKAPIEQVAELHRSTQAPKLLTPPPLFVKINQIEPLGEGSRANFTLWLGPIPICWVAVPSDVDPMEGFTDIQVEGPFQTWVHQNVFQ